VERQRIVYGDVPNVDLLSLIGSASGRVLDVGCGRGALAAGLRQIGAETLVGIDHDPRATALAVGYDQVMTSRIEDVDWEALGHFDLVVAADVLEHLKDPWAVLRQLRRSGDRLAISVPNIGHFRVIANLTRGRFTYDPGGGVMDQTHLRWFTRNSLRDALRQSGWEPVRWGGPTSGKKRLVRALVGTRLDGLLLHQVHVVSR
jgi:SAM-dependent methyltransferase